MHVLSKALVDRGIGMYEVAGLYCDYLFVERGVEVEVLKVLRGLGGVGCRVRGDEAGEGEKGNERGVSGGGGDKGDVVLVPGILSCWLLEHGQTSLYGVSWQRFLSLSQINTKRNEHVCLVQHDRYLQDPFQTNLQKLL